MRGLGYKQDAPDARDQKLAARLLAVPPPEATVEHPSVGPKDQGETSSCTGQAAAQAVRLAYLHHGVPCVELSALFPYYLARAQYGGEHQDDGSYLRTVIKGVSQVGVPAETDWPFVEERVNDHPAYRAYRSAYDRRGLRGYHRIDAGDTDGVRRAIAAGYPVIGGWQVSKGFLDWDGRGLIGAQRSSVGGHAMPIVSYKWDGSFRLLNSWGSSWGRDGYAVVDEEFISQGTDLWAVQVL